MKMKNTIRGGAIATVFWAVLLLSLLAMCTGGFGVGRPTGTSGADPRDGMRYACKEFITRQLHEPASAEWGDYWSWTVTTNNDGSYSVGAQYRAKNGFGALRLFYTTCVLRKDGENIRLEKLSQLQ